MKLSYFYIIPFSLNTNLSDIRLCKNCQYVRYNSWNNTVCSLYGKINLINGNINYDHCEVVRSNDQKCGEDGKLYVRYIPFQK